MPHVLGINLVAQKPHWLDNKQCKCAPCTGNVKECRTRYDLAMAIITELDAQAKDKVCPRFCGLGP